MISAIGNDEDGKTIIDYSKENNLETAGIIISEQNATGIVQVLLNERGSATYDIKFPSAWDFITTYSSIFLTCSLFFIDNTVIYKQCELMGF